MQGAFQAAAAVLQDSEVQGNLKQEALAAMEQALAAEGWVQQGE